MGTSGVTVAGLADSASVEAGAWTMDGRPVVAIHRLGGGFYHVIVLDRDGQRRGVKVGSTKRLRSTGEA